jgi:hypothetical protein
VTSVVHAEQPGAATSLTPLAGRRRRAPAGQHRDALDQTRVPGRGSSASGAYSVPERVVPREDAGADVGPHRDELDCRVDRGCEALPNSLHAAE